MEKKKKKSQKSQKIQMNSMKDVLAVSIAKKGNARGNVEKRGQVIPTYKMRNQRN